MARITTEDVNAWAEKTKATQSAINLDLLGHIETVVISRIASRYDTATWVDEATTPTIVKSVIAAFYFAAVYRKTYSEDTNSPPAFAVWLQDFAEGILIGIIDGTIEIIGIDNPLVSGGPSFYPDDLSSMQEPTFDDPSLGPARFSMGTIF